MSVLSYDMSVLSCDMSVLSYDVSVLSYDMSGLSYDMMLSSRHAYSCLHLLFSQGGAGCIYGISGSDGSWIENADWAPESAVSTAR